MTKEKATATWTKDAPTADGVYWWRDSAVDNDPDVHLVQGEFFYQVGFASSELVANFGGEWLGPITPEQVSERNALLSEVAQLKILYDRIFRIRATGDRGKPVQGVIDYEAKTAFEIALESLGKER